MTQQKRARVIAGLLLAGMFTFGVLATNPWVFVAFLAGEMSFSLFITAVFIGWPIDRD